MVRPNRLPLRLLEAHELAYLRLELLDDCLLSGNQLSLLLDLIIATLLKHLLSPGHRRMPSKWRREVEALLCVEGRAPIIRGGVPESGLVAVVDFHWWLGAAVIRTCH